MSSIITTFNKFNYKITWLAEHFLRFPFLGRHRKNLSDKIAINIPIVKEELLSPVPVMNNFDLEDFLLNYVKKGMPVVLKGAAKNWGAIKKWTPEFLANQYPDFPVVLYDQKKDNPELDGKVKHTTLKEYVESMKKGSKNYARFLPLLDKQPELEKDFSMSFISKIMKGGAKGKKTQLFIGGGGNSNFITWRSRIQPFCSSFWS